VNVLFGLVWPQRYLVSSAQSPDKCADRLADWVVGSTEDWNQASAAVFGQPASRERLKGEVYRSGFRIARRIPYPSLGWTFRSAFQTWAAGAFTSTERGTRIAVTLFVHPGIVWLWGIILTLCVLVGLAAVTNTLQGGWQLLLVPGTFGLLSLLPRLLALADGGYLLRFIDGAVNTSPESNVEDPPAAG
jgi:hypothetical protein